MPAETGFDHIKLIKNIPDDVLKTQKFLVYKELPSNKTGKTRKIPYYSDGQIRRDALDSKADLSRLTNFEAAVDAVLFGEFSGVGLALTGDGVAAFDIDDCLDPKTRKPIASHAGNAVIQEASRLGAYIEVSPSGKGLRILGTSDILQAYSKDGLEYWGEKRFVTLTGDMWANPKGWANLSKLRALLTAGKQPKERDLGSEGGLVTSKVINELKSALKSISSDNRELWVRMGMALKSVGDRGYDLWIEWSARSSKFRQGDADRVWETLSPSRTGYKVVFHEAQTNWEWDNPARKSGEGGDDHPEDDYTPTPQDQEIDLGEFKLHPTEFILDGFLPVGVSIVAGAWGAGKSTNLIPLVCSAAHMAPEEWGFRPDIRRKIIWITEAPEQARDTLYSICKSGNLDWGEMKQWFRLFRAKRQDPRKIAKLLMVLVKEMTFENEQGYMVTPVIVLDTTAANLELENESDNSQVSRAMAVLKQKLPNVSIVLIGHTPKSLVKAEVTDLTFRGAGAWEADAVATYFLVHDEELDLRYLAIRKCRFTPTYREILFTGVLGSEIVDTPWGDAQSKSFMHGVPKRSDGAERKSALIQHKANAAEEKEEKDMTERQGKILTLVSAEADQGRGMTSSGITAAIGGNKALARAAIDRLVEEGTLVLHEMVVMGRPKNIYLPPEIDPVMFEERMEKKWLDK